MEYFDVLDADGMKTGAVVERGEAHAKGILHKVVHVWLINAAGELLLQKRSKVKDLHPDQWYVSLGGHIESGETNEQTIVREFMEELGLDVSGCLHDVRYLYTFRELIEANEGTFIDDAFYDVHMLRMNVNIEELILQEDEVQEVKWCTYEAFKQAVQNRDEQYWIHEEGFAVLFRHMDGLLLVR
ncbi:NUDIX hydrolase [Paenibacillus kobensis]|uniref:NUDIX hydrolase n=1 Tax=Paenibacillus kobensis TaxID=59841 RepID=UPI0013E2D064|nr:NUDIX domain-containing protein [Paenibacillus kobensis]